MTVTHPDSNSCHRDSALKKQTTNREKVNASVSRNKINKMLSTGWVNMCEEKEAILHHQNTCKDPGRQVLHYSHFL